jgi:hypothetical protein
MLVYIRSMINRQKFTTTGLIAINIFILVIIFSFPPISLSNEHRYQADPSSQNKLLDSVTGHFIAAEFQKGINEIQMRIEDQSRWFQYKFLFVGGLLAAFLGLFPYIRLKTSLTGEKSLNNSGILLERALRSPPATVALASVCSLSLMIDIHIRGNAIVVNQIGLWIASYIEPFYLNTNVFLPGSFVPWEIFLRSGGAMYTDVVNSITFFWPIHILTIFCFLLYFLSTRTSLGKEKRIPIKTEVLSFWVVHLCLIVLAWTGHYLPPIYQVKIPLLGIQHGVLAALPYTFIAMILTMINWFFTFRFQKFAEAQKE